MQRPAAVTKPFAILTLVNLRLFRFGSRDEWRATIADFTARNVPIVVVSYNESQGCYQQSEVHA